MSQRPSTGSSGKNKKAEEIFTTTSVFQQTEGGVKM
jgi:hypothetical protein